MSFTIKWVSCRQHIIGSYFTILFANLFWSDRAFGPLTFKIVIDRYVFIAILNLVFQLILCFFFVPYFFLLWFGGFLLYCLSSLPRYFFLSNWKNVVVGCWDTDACEPSRCWWKGSSGHINFEIPFRPSGRRASSWLKLWGRSCRESSRLENSSESSAPGLETGAGQALLHVTWHCLTVGHWLQSTSSTTKGKLLHDCSTSMSKYANMQMWTQSDCGQQQLAHTDAYTLIGFGAQRWKHLALRSHIFIQHKLRLIARTHFNWFFGQNSGHEIYQCFIYM